MPSSDASSSSTPPTTLCLILARRGSQGLPHKNRLPLAGRPMVTHTIDFAQQSDQIDHLAVSSDDPDVLSIAQLRGIDTIDRPAELAGHTAPIIDAVAHALTHLQTTQNKTFDLVVILYANVPKRPAGLIDQAIDKLLSTQCDSVQSVAPVGKYHPYWMKKLTGDQTDQLAAYRPNNIDRRQNLPPLYLLDGGLIVARTKNILTPDAKASADQTAPNTPHHFLGDDQRAIITQPGDVIDIDQPNDLHLAEAALTSSPIGTTKKLTINHHLIAPAKRPYVIAELGVNHDGSVNVACDLVAAAHKAGAQAIKVQYFQTDQLLSAEAILAAYQKSHATDPYAMLKRLELSHDQLQEVRACAKQYDLDFIVTCFNLDLVETLESLAPDAIKVASPDAVNRPLVEALCTLNRPMLLSLGAMADDDHPVMDQLIRTTAALQPTALLHCVSAYPTPIDQAHLKRIAQLAKTYSLPIGFSDHTPSIEMGLLAAAHGACLLEKHLTHNTQADGPDHAASFDPVQLKQYIDLIHLGHRAAQPTEKTSIESDVRLASRQSLCAKQHLSPGDRLTEQNMTVKRPGHGIPAAHWPLYLGRRVKNTIESNHLITPDALEPLTP